MKYTDVEYQKYVDNDLEIYIDEDWWDAGWWQSYTDLKYTYTCDKDRLFSHNYLTVGAYLEGYGTGYFAVLTSILLNNVGNYSIYDRYIELLEFGLNENEEKYCKSLFEYLIYYSRLSGAKFIKINKKYADFNSFYSFVEQYDCALIDNCYYVKIDNPIEYEDLKHIRIYEEDLLDINDIAYLKMIGLNIERDVCYIKFRDESLLSIQRKTKKVTYPKNVLCDENETSLQVFNKYHYALIHYILRNYYSMGDNNKMILNYKVDNVDYMLHKLNDKIILLDDIKRISMNNKDNDYLDFLLSIKENTKFNKLDIFTTSFFIENLNYIGCLENIDIDKEINSIMSCIDVEGFSQYPPSRVINNVKIMNDKIKDISVFELKINSKNINVEYMKIDFIKSCICLRSNSKETLIENINKNKYINILSKAYFSNWDNEYYSNDELNKIEWEIKLYINEDVLKYKGLNKTPNIWKYFIPNLLKI